MTGASQSRRGWSCRLARRLRLGVPPAGVVGLLAAGLLTVRAQEPAPLAALARMRILVGQAETLQRQGRTNEALKVATEAIRTAPEAVDAWMARGRLRAANGALRDASGDFAKVLELQPNHAEARVQRAMARFLLGRLTRSLEDFDKLAQLAPRAPELWQRGVALSLAGRHADAREQFESYRQTHTNDVEVAAWHFLSVARLEGLPSARSNLMAVVRDPRVPMPEIWRLYAGQGTAEALDAAADAASDEPVKGAARFYARLYGAMYLDATGETTDAASRAAEAARLAGPFGFLGQAARLYAAQLRERVAARPSAATVAESVRE